jgi:DNA-binding response OmpR family regulator/anti-sigma regulatory factor (Ser/Thr protein kinase)
MKVLIAEDDNVSRRALCSMLQRQGHEVLESSDGAQAWEIMQNREPPCLMILDILMPKMNGLELCRKIRAQETLNPVYIILLTAKTEKEDIIRGLETGANDYMSKPCDFGELMARINVGQRMLEMQSTLVARTQELETTLKKLRQTQAQLINQERQRSLALMTRGIAHDFNNTLASIMGFTDLMLQIPQKIEDKEAVRGYLRQIERAANHATETVRRMRHFYRPREDARIRAINLNRIVEEAVSLTQPQWKQGAQARGTMIELHSDLSDLPKISGNRSELYEVVTNLILNAVDAIQGKGTISLKTYEQAGQVVLEVTDSGHGMTEDILNKCLDPFFSTKGDSGSGLGLAIVNGIMEFHQGSIEIHSQKAQGTKCLLFFPKDQCKDKEHQVSQVVTQMQTSFRVLIVEDESQQRQLLRDFFEASGFVVGVAKNGREGLQLFDASQYDLVITDRAMPDINGDVFAQEVKKRSPDTPVIMLTGFGDLMEASSERPEGIALLLSKPVSLQRLRQAVQEIMANNSVPVID